jgi:hypothetical protein
MRHGAPSATPPTGTASPQASRPRPAPEPQGNASTPAGGQRTGGQGGEPMFVQMLRSMLAGSVSYLIYTHLALCLLMLRTYHQEFECTEIKLDLN